MASFGRYTLVRRVGAGGMAEIWKAKVLGPAGFEKTVAVKRILPEFSDDAEFVEMFVNEAKLVADLVHPNIVQVLDFGSVGKREYFIAMEYVSGVNLGRVLTRLREGHGTLPKELAFLVLLETARGLGYAHSKMNAAGRPLGIVHRDVSPSNILVSFGGEVKVADFGIARAVNARPTTAEGFVRGKVCYMSPEQAVGGTVDHRSDLFSLGLVMYEVFTGLRYFTAASPRALYEKVSSFTGPSEADLAIFPAELRPVVARTLQPDPARRYQAAVEIEAAIAPLLGTEGQMLARHGLASIVQTVCADEQAVELTPGLGLERPPAPAASLAPTSSRASAGGGGVGGDTEVPAAVSEPAPSDDTVRVESGSNPTFAKPAVKVTASTPSPALERVLAEAKKRPWLAPAIAGALVFVVGWFAATHFPSSGAKPTPPAATVGVTAPLQWGSLSVTSRAGVEVWIDGTRVAGSTPLVGFRLAAGAHELKVVHRGATAMRRIDVPADGALSVAVEVSGRELRITTR